MLPLGNSYLWHEKYFIPYTSVLVFVVFCVPSKLCGIGPAERSWGGVKQVKDGKRSHLSGELTKKRSILFVSLKISQARTKYERLEDLVSTTGHNKIFGDDDINFVLQLERFSIETRPLREPAVARVFQAWVRGSTEEE